MSEISARKRAVNLSLRSDLVRQARAHGINLSSFVEDRLAEELRRRRWESWQRDNREAIDAYNRHVERDGIFGEEYRRY